MGMQLETLLQLTPYQFSAAYEKFIEQRHTDRESAETTQWRIARWQVWRQLCPPNKKTLSQTDLLELPGDKVEKTDTKPKKDENRFRKLAKKWR